MSAPVVERRTPYRPDIDGLRALSVIAVILFHAELPGVGGGFVGVDVFFVISGYLITQWLRARDGSGPGSLLREFYLRRARRILPALVLMLAVTTLLSYLWLQPADLTRYGRYLLAAVFMAGNFTAWTEGDYFNSAVGFAPLLHLWSIAVEEQFYLLFPLLMWALQRYRAGVQAAVIAICALGSLALCAWASYTHPVANFYFGGSRAWELLLGGLVAYGLFDGLARQVTTSLAAAGLLAIVVPVFLFDRNMHHPGLITLIPTLGTAAFIAAGRIRETLPARLSSFKPCVITGQASYSLYLWHLPVMVLATYYFIERPQGWKLWAVLAAGVVVAFATWAGFEQPVRRRQWLHSNRLFVTVMLGGLLVFALAGLAFARSGGLPQRFSAAEQKLLNSAMFHRDVNRCMTLTIEEIAAGRLCSYGPQTPKSPRAVLWGDSHALALLPAFEDLAGRMGVRVYFAGRSACRPLPGFRDGTRLRDGQVECLDYNAAMHRAVKALEPDVVVLAAFWAYPAGEVVRDDDASRSHPLTEALQESVQVIGNSTPRICVLRDVPVLRHSVPYGLVMAARRGVDSAFLREFDPAWRERQEAAESAIDALPRAPWMVIADPRTRLCQADTCKIESDGEALYRDTNHLSVRGAHYVSDSLAGCFADLR